MAEELSMRRLSLAAVATAALAYTGPVAAAGEVIELHGIGSQIYVCDTSPSGVAWRFKAPEAKLVDGNGADVGHHFGGPSWQAKDGSTVVGEVLISSSAPQPGAIAWLVLRAKSHTGNGVFASVDFIVRTQTEGGLAPAAGCDATHAGTESQVPYKALYLFFQKP
jgi:hypothetical protein